MVYVTFDQENQERIHAVEISFGPSGKRLSQPGRVLIGQGQLMKQSRRGPQPKVFFLFNDVLVYGSIILKGHWNKKQQIILLGEHLILICSSQLYIEQDKHRVRLVSNGVRA